MTIQKKVELLAPAGNVSALYGAIKAGADAVYLAGNQYGARAYAENFTDEQILEGLRYAHLLHKKIYLTVNTLMKEEELEALPNFLRPFVEEGLDGVIVQDFGALKTIREHFPQLPLHASTQMCVTGVEGVKALRSFGVVRVVPARELSLKEIQKIIREGSMEVECFIHGAMCYSYSGMCLFSSFLGGRSGNRGRCAQPCRLPYQIQEDPKSTRGKECYPLSLKDMCTLDLIPELIEAGISSFKIEGRMKKPEYAAGVTAIYRKYIDLYESGNWCAPSRKDRDMLNSLYIRSEIGTGYYHCQNGREMVTLNSPSYRGSEDAVLDFVRKQYLEEREKIPICIKGVFRIDREAEIWVARDEASPRWVVVRGDVVQRASKSPVTRENLTKQLSKLGDSPFQLAMDETRGKLTLEMDEDLFYSLKRLNDLRREAVKALEEVILHET